MIPGERSRWRRQLTVDVDQDIANPASLGIIALIRVSWRVNAA